MTWVVIALVVWPVVAVAAALVIGRAIRLADRSAGTASDEPPNVVVDETAVPPVRPGTGGARNF